LQPDIENVNLIPGNDVACASEIADVFVGAVGEGPAGLDGVCVDAMRHELQSEIPLAGLIQLSRLIADPLLAGESSVPIRVSGFFEGRFLSFPIDNVTIVLPRDGGGPWAPFFLIVHQIMSLPVVLIGGQRVHVGPRRILDFTVKKICLPLRDSRSVLARFLWLELSIELSTKKPYQVSLTYCLFRLILEVGMQPC
jgi:hypothetical protein